MRTDYVLKALAACVLFGLAVTVPVEARAQNKTATHRSSTKAKAAARHKTRHKVATTRAKAKLPKTGVVRTGAFRPLKNDDRMTVIMPRRPASTTRANLATAKSRTRVFTERTVTASPQTIGMVTANNSGTTALIVNSPNTSWWGSDGPPSTSYYDGRYGWITVVAYPWGNVMYTYGYQVVNYWNGNGYVWIAYPGVAGVAYPVLYR